MSKTQDKIKSERQKLTNQIIENLEKEGQIWKKGWDSSLFSPHNPTSNSTYKGYNKIKLMIEAQERGYKDPRWMTYKQAQDNGWQVNKGAKGVSCEFWKFENETKVKDLQGNITLKKEKLPYPFCNSFTLFNATDITGIPELPQRESFNDSELNIINNTLIKSSECEIKEIASESAFYRPSEDKIYLPLRESFNSTQEFTATLIHEMAHSTGHPDRLNREKGKTFGDELYAKEELRAELSAVFTQNSLNLELDTTLDNHSAYVCSWIKALKNDYNEIYRAASDAEKISDRLVSNYQVIEKERVEELVQSPITRDPFKGLTITHHHSEVNHQLGIEDNTTLKGKEAYKYLEKVIALDNKIYSEREDPNSQIARSQTTFSYKLNNYKKNNNRAVRYDLGRGDFGGCTKVSEALEYRFKSHLKLLEYQKDHLCKTHNIPQDRFLEDIKIEENEMNKMIKSLKSKELKHEKTIEPEKKYKILFPGRNKSKENELER